MAGKDVLYNIWVKIQPLERIVYTSRFWLIFQIPRIVGKSSAHTVGVFPMRPNPRKRHIQQKSTILIDNFNNDFKNPLELRLVMCALLWVERWLVNKIFYTVWAKIQPLNKMLTLLDCWVIFENSQNCRQIIGMPRRSIFHAANYSQMQNTANKCKI